MIHYFIRRILLSLLTLFLISIATFAILKIAPGGPIDMLLFRTGGALSETVREAYVKKFGLDKPIHLQYLYWIGNTLRGDLGLRMKNSRPITEEVAKALPNTLELMGVGLGMAVLVGIPIGIIMAIKQYSLLDYGLTVFAFVGVSIPAFFLAFFLIYVFCIRLSVLPIGGTTTPGQPWSLINHLKHLAIPSLSLAVAEFAATSRYARSSMLEKMNAQYVTTARSKGLAEWRVLTKHAFRTALSPIVTMLSLRLRDLIAGTVVIETVMSWPGMGMLFMDAVSSRDFTLLMGLTLITGAAMIGANLLADLAYALLDPRVRYY